MTIADAQKVLDFWFDPVHADLLFASNDAFDQKIRDNFYDTWEAGCQGLLSSWRTSAEGRLAEIIVLDQFSRNLQRGCPESFTQDLAALVLAKNFIITKITINSTRKKSNLPSCRLCTLSLPQCRPSQCPYSKNSRMMRFSVSRNFTKKLSKDLDAFLEETMHWVAHRPQKKSNICKIQSESSKKSRASRSAFFFIQDNPSLRFL